MNNAPPFVSDWLIPPIYAPLTNPARVAIPVCAGDVITVICKVSVGSGLWLLTYIVMVGGVAVGIGVTTASF